ncbi:hypothetical protein SMB34_17125 [Thalassospira permensis NBRC 106175]|uniref:Uncharacterized protein n=1 Tax=Thalassospira permensis NBRC 106175 TaxID=1353532 RepID=A0ABR4TP95_9PROT|nr:hypothetical protein SMB34_17125 [Thalassospira permensis NBRC 106175]
MGREIDFYLVGKVLAELLQVFTGLPGLNRSCGFEH